MTGPESCGAQLVGGASLFTCTRAVGHTGKHEEKVPYQPTEGHPEPWIRTNWSDDT